MKVDVKDIGHKWNQLPKDEKNKYIQMGRLQSEQYLQSKTVVQQKAPKVKIQTRIELTSICNIIRRLDKAQQQAVVDMGFSGILSLRCTHIDHDLSHWLVQNFDPSTRSLNVHGLRLVLTVKDVHKLMGLPSNGVAVKSTGFADKITNLYDELAVKNKFVPLKFLKSYLFETKDAGTEFKRKFVLYIMGALLCPTTKAGVHQSFIEMVKNIESISQFNWAKHTLDFLVNRIHIAKEKERSDVCGCLPLLMLFYLERFALKRELVAASNPIPRLSYWGDSEIRQGLKRLKALGGYLNHEVVLPLHNEKSHAQCLSEGRTDNDDDSRLATVEKQVSKIHALLLQGHKDKRHDEDRLAKVENQVGKIFELLEQRMPFNGHVKTPPSKLPEEQRSEVAMVDLNVSGIEKVPAKSTKFEDDDGIGMMNDKEAMETPRLRKTSSVVILSGNESFKLTEPKAKAVAKKQAKLVDGKALNNEQLSIAPRGRSRPKKAVEVNAVTSSSCSVIRGPQTRGTEKRKASQWVRTPFVKLDVVKKRPQLKPSPKNSDVDTNIDGNLDQVTK